jgi:hypothetical protein
LEDNELAADALTVKWGEGQSAALEVATRIAASKRAVRTPKPLLEGDNIGSNASIGFASQPWKRSNSRRLTF